MNYRNVFLALLALTCVVGFANAADEMLKVAPRCCTVLLENDEVRVLDYVGKAGEKVGMHMHPDHVIYALSDGKVRFTMEDGSNREVELKKGQALFTKAVTHATENIGSNDIHVIMVEMKEELKAKSATRGYAGSEDETTYKVVVNDDGQYSIWPADRENAMGWSNAGFSGNRQECFDYIRSR